MLVEQEVHLVLSVSTRQGALGDDNNGASIVVDAAAIHALDKLDLVRKLGLFAEHLRARGHLGKNRTRDGQEHR